MITLYNSSMRLSGIDKVYMQKQLETFASRLDPKLFKTVSIGRQDTRGGFSVALGDHDHGQPQQRHFNSKEMMLGFIIGCNMMYSKSKNKLITDIQF